MTRPAAIAPTLRAALAVLCALVLFAGCPSRPVDREGILTPLRILSSDGYLSYRVPAGWLDVTADAAAGGLAVWLLRPDYRASITVDEVRLDPRTRALVETEGGMLDVARATLQLAAGDTAAVVERRPEEMRINGSPACSYDVRTAAGDIMRTVLIRAGERVYAVAALLPERELRDREPGVFAAQRAFLESLGW